MNVEKLDQKTMMLIVVVCAAVCVMAVLIDVQISRNLAAKAQELDEGYRLRKWEDEITRSAGTPFGAPVYRDHGSDSVVGDSGVETGENSSVPEGEIPQGWDVYPADRSQTHAAAGIRNLAVPQGGRKVEP